MASNSVNVRHFRRVAEQRFEDASLLLEAHRNTGAVYLAGYAVECMLKALLLAVVPAAREQEILESFRGSRAHDYEHLKQRYTQESGQPIERVVAPHLTHVNQWGTEMRYSAGMTRIEDAEDFFDAVVQIMNWVKGKL